MTYYMCTYMYMCISLSLSIYIYIYVLYIYTYIPRLAPSAPARSSRAWPRSCCLGLRDVMGCNRRTHVIQLAICDSHVIYNTCNKRTHVIEEHG